MRAQHRRLAHAERRAVALVTDTSADLADPVLDRHHIALVPLQVVFGDETFRDRVELKPEEFYRRLRGARELPTTSQPTPADFVRVLRDARGGGRRGGRRPALGRALGHLRVGAGGGPGGGDQRRPPGGQPVGLARSRHAGAAGRGARGVGLDAGRDIARELERVRGQAGMLLTVDRYDNLLRSGRVSRGKAWIAGMLDVKPILSLDASGRVIPVDRVRGKDQVVPRVLALLDKRLTPRPKVVRFGVAHAEAPEMAERVRNALVAAYQPRDCFVTLATGVLATHVGPGAWAIFYQVEDGPAGRIGPPWPKEPRE